MVNKNDDTMLVVITHRINSKSRQLRTNLRGTLEETRRIAEACGYVVTDIRIATPADRQRYVYELGDENY